MSNPKTAQRFAVPAGTCDCHIHAYGPAELYPEAPTSRIPAPNAPIEAYREVMADLGVERVVVVQPSTYGKDNRCTLDAMAALGSCARGVVVVDGDTTDKELARLTELGVRGVRFHMLAGGLLPWQILEEMAARIDAFGWHRDSRYGIAFDLRLKALGIRSVRTPFRSPQANAIAERWVKSVRTESLDHYLILNERHLRRILTEYVTWFNRWRPHRSLGQQPPCPETPAVRFSIRNGTGITARPVLGGLHHVYELAA